MPTNNKTTSKKYTTIGLLDDLVKCENPFHIQKALHHIVSDYKTSSTNPTKEKEEVLQAVGHVVNFIDKLTNSINEYI